MNSKALGKLFVSKNPDVIDFLSAISSGTMMSSNENNKYFVKPKKHPKTALKWKSERESRSNKSLDKMSSSLKTKMDFALNDVDVRLIKPTDARLGFGQHKTQTYANIVKKEPGYLTWMCSVDIENSCPSARLFFLLVSFRWTH